ncbi:hypothetical protein [Streptomyces sp. cg35]|uniref:hypothetical protein n=1 Tax=Streptomyces sp. cg35 TaxID=3421650 RepID=UPI003D1758B0
MIQTPMLSAVTPAQLDRLNALLDHAQASYDTRVGDEFKNAAARLARDGDGPWMVRLMVHQAGEHVEIEFGDWTGFTKVTRALAERRSSAETITNTRVAALLLRNLDTNPEVFSDALDDLGDDVLIILMAALAGLCAKARALGRWPVVIDFARPGWSPDPKKFPEMRRRLHKHLGAPETRRQFALSLAVGQYSLRPDADTAEQAARIQLDEERARLARARLYWMDPESWPIACRKALRPRTEPLLAHRVPSAYGLLFFPQPVQVEGGADVVAVSWGRWNIDSVESWIGKTTDGLARLGEQFVDPGHPSWWLTYYARPPEAAQQDLGSPLAWENETCFASGGKFSSPVPQPDDTEYVLRHLVACWEMITQGRGKAAGRPITTVTRKDRKPQHVRRDRRGGLQDDGAVHIVTIGRPDAPRRPAVSKPAVPGSRKPLDKRHWVLEHTKGQCPNTRRHAELGDACVHEEVTILDYPRGPQDAPFAMSNTVHQYKDRP